MSYQPKRYGAPRAQRTGFRNWTRSGTAVAVPPASWTLVAADGLTSTGTIVRDMAGLHTFRPTVWDLELGPVTLRWIADRLDALDAGAEKGPK